MMYKKTASLFELVILLVSTFSFAYIIGQTQDVFRVESNEENNNGFFKELLNSYFNLIKKPLIGFVSAQTSLTTGLGCCSEAVNGDLCAITDAVHCKEGALFSVDSLCSAAPSCQKGCCYDKNRGIFERNVLKSRCSLDWVAKPNCDLPEATRGCCVVGSISKFETQGECKVDTKTVRGNDAILDWRKEVGEAECSLLSYAGDKGACVLSSEECVILSERNCVIGGGIFSEGYLCTSERLNTTCKKTDKTTCVEGKDGVYFKDSCGNIANIYDSSKVNDQSYWEKIIGEENSCNPRDSNGNANSLTCGNCNRFRGGICTTSEGSSVRPTVGNNYCSVTSCKFEEKTYKNGESWCAYDGKIGDGDDIPGSRHWRYVCNQGRVDQEPCADYRNQICIQSDKMKFGDQEIEFSQSNCVNNNWRECTTLNSDEDGVEKCQDALNCEVRNIYVAEYFNFSVCTPKYPGGFDIRDARYQATSTQICGAATVNCTVMYKQDFFGSSCEVMANEGCLSEKFGQEMNDYCRALGDCGSEPNIEGKLTKNYKIINSENLSEVWKTKLKNLARPVPGQSAEPEDYTKYLEALGLWGGPDDPEEYRNKFNWGMVGGAGVAGWGLGALLGMTGWGAGLATLFGAAPLAGSAGAGLAGLGMGTGTGVAGSATAIPGGTATAGSAFGAFAGVAIGAVAGAIAGQYFAQKMGLSPFGTILMASGGAMVGAVVGYAAYLYIIGSLATIGPVGWVIAIIGLIIIAISTLFKEKCPPKEVQFQCKVWQPPRGGSDCEKCNDNPNRPCSKYRCETLGQRCEFVDQEGDGWDKCVDADPNDVSPPVVAPLTEVIGEGLKYSAITDTSFRIETVSGGCVPANTPLLFGVKTNEMALCKFDVENKDFEEMLIDFGGEFYKINHTTVFPLPDPTHGRSLGSNWTGEVKFYLKCEDRGGLVTPRTHLIELCVAQGPDITPPVIRAIEPRSGTMVGFNQTNRSVKVITNELSTCKWSVNDVTYDSMENTMQCNDPLYAPSSIYGFVCTGSFPTSAQENNYYIGCKDQPWLTGADESKRSANHAERFTLNKPSSQIKIDSVEPSGKIVVGSSPTTVDVTIKTGGGASYHKCFYSISGYQTMFEILGVGTEREFKIPINLGAGNKKVYVRCEDDAGDKATSSTEFEIIVDDKVPDISRLWKIGSTLHFITSESSECRYSIDNCGFLWNGSSSAGIGLSHQIGVVRGPTYYIKCMDGFGNVPTQCSLAVRV